MKKWICAALAMVMLMGCAGAVAQEYVSIQEVYDQAQAMGGWWKETFDTPNGQVTIDAPIIVPDVEKMPVITVEKAKISEELFNQIAQGKKLGSKDEHRYELEMNGETVGFYLGRDNYWIFGEQTDYTGYDAFQELSMYHGGYLSSLNTGMGTAEKRAQPTTFHLPWQLDADASCVRESDITLNEAMRLWHEDIELCYPGEDIVIRPTRIKLRGSILETNSKRKNKRDGYLVIEGAEQLIGGIPLLGTIDDCYVPVNGGGSSAELNRIEDKLDVYRVGSDSVGTHFYGNFTDENNYRTISELARIRTTEYMDVPLAALESVLGNITDKIEAGIIRRIHSIKLGYIMYSNPDMTDYAWAIPRWEVQCDYVTKALDKEYKRPFSDDGDECAFWGNLYSTNLAVHAQSGELIIFAYGDEKNAEIFTVPDMITWDEVK